MRSRLTGLAACALLLQAPSTDGRRSTRRRRRSDGRAVWVARGGNRNSENRNWVSDRAGRAFHEHRRAGEKKGVSILARANLGQRLEQCVVNQNQPERVNGTMDGPSYIIPMWHQIHHVPDKCSYVMLAKE